VNAEQWNAMYPVGTLVFAYPGFRPEDDRNVRRLVTQTRTKAQVSASGDPVVWVDGEGSYICLTHVDPVSESVWQAAKSSESCGAREPEPRTGTSPCVLPAGHGGLKHQDKWTNQWPARPVPVGDQPQPLDDTRLAEIREHVASTRNWSLGNLAARDLLAEVERLKAELAGARKELDEYEVMTSQQCRAGKHADWLVDSEYTHACPWCRIAEVRTEALAEAKDEVVEWLVKKAHEGTEVSRLADKVERGAIRIFFDAERSAAAPVSQHYDKVPDPQDGCHWCACGNRWPCKHAEEAAS
jgi:hypothetical protein